MTRGIHALLLLLLLACAPAPSSLTRDNLKIGRCFHDDRWMEPGQIVTKPMHCFVDECICDTHFSGRTMHSHIPTGCLDQVTNKCFQDKETAVVTRPGQSPMQCTCISQPNRGFLFQCKYVPKNTCKDVRTGEEKRIGEQVRFTDQQTKVTLLCTCVADGHGKDCIPEESVGKCLDVRTNRYVPSGSTVSALDRDDGGVILCTCVGTGGYENCRSETCKDVVDGSRKKAGEKVTLLSTDNKLLVCDCLGVKGVGTCVTKEAHDNPDKCKDEVRNIFVARGEKLYFRWGGKLFQCTCSAELKKEGCIAQ